MYIMRLVKAQTKSEKAYSRLPKKTLGKLLPTRPHSSVCLCVYAQGAFLSSPEKYDNN